MLNCYFLRALSLFAAVCLTHLDLPLNTSSTSPPPSQQSQRQGDPSEVRKDEPNQKNPAPAANPNPAPVVSSDKVPSDYRVGAEDELTISVWHEPELSQGVVIRPDGVITLPLMNDIKVVGLTTAEIQALLIEKLKPIVNDPQVTVIIKAVHSRKVFLIGNVAKQGVYPLGSRKTVLELIAEAGGLGPFAKTKSIYILRKENGKEIRLPFNYKRALAAKSDNPELLPGDMVVVP